MAYRQDQIEARELRATTVFKLGKGNAETLGGSRTIVNGEGPVLAFDAGGSSRNVTLPARADINDGVFLLIHNISTAGENLTIKNSAASTLATCPSGGVAMVFASVADETPGTREWKAALIGGEDLALSDSLVVTGNFTLAGNAAIGDSSGDLLAFHGQTATSMRSGAAGIAVTFTSLVANSGSVSFTTWGFSTATAASALVTLVNEIRSALVEVGLMKGA